MAAARRFGVEGVIVRPLTAFTVSSTKPYRFSVSQWIITGLVVVATDRQCPIAAGLCRSVPRAVSARQHPP